MRWLGLWVCAALLAVSGCAGPEGESIAAPRPADGAAGPRDGAAGPRDGSAGPAVGQPEQADDLPASAGPFGPCLTEPVVHLPDGATPTAAHVCTTEVAPVPGDGEWLFTVTSRVTAGLPRLLQAYRTPDADRTDGPCTMELPNPRMVLLQIGEATVPVRAPYDGCAKPIPSAVQAYDGLVTVVESRQPVHQVQSQQAVDTGCEQEWKDMLAIEADAHRPAPAAVPTPLTGAAKVCTYDVVEPGVGRLAAGHTLTSAELTKVNAALAQARPDGDCRRDGHHRFAVLLPTDNGEPTHVALDGCAVTQGSAWWRAPDALRHALS